MADSNMRRSAQVILDGNGYGIVRIAPSASNWHIRYITVSAAPATPDATVKIYRDQIGAAYMTDSTQSGSSGDTSDTEYDIFDGSCLYVEWSGGASGATATVVYSGAED